MYWVLLCLSSGTDLQKSRHVLKSFSLCNKVLSYLILSYLSFWWFHFSPSWQSWTQTFSRKGCCCFCFIYFNSKDKNKTDNFWSEYAHAKAPTDSSSSSVINVHHHHTEGFDVYNLIKCSVSSETVLECLHWTFLFLFFLSF